MNADERLEQIPEELIVDFVVILHFGRLYERSEEARAAIGRGLLQVAVPSLYVCAEKSVGPLRIAEVRQRVVDIVRQVALGLAKILDAGNIAVQACLEYGQHHQVRIGIR